MARLMGIPTAICEQNSIPGLTNKILGRFARKVFLAFEESRRFFKPKKVVLSGNPVRRAPWRVSETVPRRRVFVCGGSQGATRVNELASQAIVADGGCGGDGGPPDRGQGCRGDPRGATRRLE